MKKRRQFTPEEKSKIIMELIQGEKTLSEICSTYEIHSNQILRWKKQFLDNMVNAFKGADDKAHKEQQQLEAEKEALLKKIGQLTIEVDWLKKNLASNKSVEERKNMLEPDFRKICIKRQCELLQINRTGTYYQPKPKDGSQILLMQLIDLIHMKHPYYGSRRMVEELKGLGYEVNCKRIQKYMRLMRLKIHYPGPNLSKRNRQHKIYPYLLRNVPITRVNQVWGVDLTYIPMPKGHMYLFVIIDWYSRTIIDYQLSNTLECDFILRCLKRGFTKAKPEIINSDQGSQFTSNDYISLLKEQEIKISMDSKGRATDNAITERFFRNIKQEKLYLYAYETVGELRALVDEYMDFYNRERKHQSLDYQIPYNVYMAA
nr:IS3 family transposase [Geosporobacter ferrireducens]